MRDDLTRSGFALIWSGSDGASGAAALRPGRGRQRVKPILLAGIVVAVIGVFLLARNVSYASHRSSVSVGGMTVSAEEHRAVPPWVGIVVVAGGALMIGAGLRRRTS